MVREEVGTEEVEILVPTAVLALIEVAALVSISVTEASLLVTEEAGADRGAALISMKEPVPVEWGVCHC